MNEIAREFSVALSRAITPRMMKEQLATFGMPPHMISHVATMTQLHRDHRYDRVSNDVERLTGIPPMSVQEFVQNNARGFYPRAGTSTTSLTGMRFRNSEVSGQDLNLRCSGYEGRASE
jgi:hypothetical protein